MKTPEDVPTEEATVKKATCPLAELPVPVYKHVIVVALTHETVEQVVRPRMPVGVKSNPPKSRPIRVREVMADIPVLG